jgi:hypothetical protein
MRFNAVHSTTGTGLAPKGTDGSSADAHSVRSSQVVAYRFLVGRTGTPNFLMAR